MLFHLGLVASFFTVTMTLLVMGGAYVHITENKEHAVEGVIYSLIGIACSYLMIVFTVKMW